MHSFFNYITGFFYWTVEIINMTCEIFTMSKIYSILITTNAPHFEFALQCGFIGSLVLMIDGIVSYLNKTDNKSLLKIRYSRKNIFPIGVAWITGASVMGFLGSFLQLTANTPTAMGTIGISWPFIFSKMVGSLGEKEDEVDDNLLEEEFDDFDEDLDESENSDDIMSGE